MRVLTYAELVLGGRGKEVGASSQVIIGVVKKSANYSLSNVEKWMAPKKGQIPLLFFPSRGEVLPEPLGVVLILVPWNFPISLALDPVIGAISAGNTIVLKPSELAPACSAFLARTIPLYLDHTAIKVIEGGTDIAEQLLQQRWDKIFFTGSPRVGRIVMSEAAKHLTPVTLELGGKCPAILDSLSDPSDIKVAAKRIAGGKWGPCSGQACIAVDYVLVEHEFASILIESLKNTISRFYGGSLENLKNLSRIVNKHHFDRLRNILKDPIVAASILTNIQQSIEFINSKPKPLALYAFTKNETFKKQILTETSSGSVTFNDVMPQFLCDTLPFGGVGQSGFGRYHGKYSFDTFSHEKAVLHRSYFLELEPRYPPWNDFKMEFIRLAYKFDYLGLLLLLLGFQLRRTFTSNHLD
ncbi:hypothetical protein TEA_028503 [Camellia sinensis var. sinensis]|uniref:Aldehyde dehydrogenase n=1 Tax=Camellia sinensis var. sinensis TaxID=542762 RepID=A0A4S4ESC0_CAMSN|nr:hypothetical protein TEA_028503 [Camellia sinensis var. sinensis]